MGRYLALLGAAILSVTSVIAQTVVTPYTDGQCNKPVQGYSWDNQLNANFTIDRGWPNVEGYGNPKFPGAEASSNAGGYTVYWGVPQPDPSCRFVLMLEYSQQQYGSLGFQAPYGNVILNVGVGGCFFSSIPSGTYLYTSFCCGSGDCANYAVGNAGIRKRDAEVKDVPETSLETREIEMSSQIQTGERSVKRSSHSVTARAAELVASNTFAELAKRQNFDASGCKAVNVAGPNPQAGRQSLVATTQTCSTAACSFSISQALTTSTTLTATSDQSVTNTVGASISFTVGVNLIAEADTTVGASYSFAKTIGESTSTAVSNGTTTTVTNTIGQALGTTAFVTFTPTYLCWFPQIDCGAGPSPPFTFCQPQMTPDGHTLLGDYTVVYTD